MKRKMTPSRIYLAFRFHINSYHSYRRDTPDEPGFGQDIRISRSRQPLRPRLREFLRQRGDRLIQQPHHKRLGRRKRWRERAAGGANRRCQRIVRPLPDADVAHL